MKHGMVVGAWIGISVFAAGCTAEIPNADLPQGDWGAAPTPGLAVEAGPGAGWQDTGSAPSTADSGAFPDARVAAAGDDASLAIDSGPSRDAAPDARTGDAQPLAHDAGATEASVPVAAIPLTSPDGTYYMAQTTVGSQMFDLDVDTGSATTGIASNTCTTCASAHVSPLYTPSSTAVDLKMMAGAMYGDGSSWSGEIFQDSVGLGHGTPDVQLELVEINSNRMFFRGGSYQGILGLGPSQLVERGTNAYPTVLVADGVASILAFELCASQGTMWLGGVDASAAATAFEYTPLLAIGRNNPFYAISVDDMLIGGKSLGFQTAAFQSPILDTGTTLMYFPTPVFNAMVSAITQSTGFASVFGQAKLDASGCVQARGTATAADVDAALPEMAVKLPNATPGAPDFTLTVPPSQSYMLDAGRGMFCLAVGDGKTTQGAILGDAFLTAFVTVIDRTNGRVGLAPDTGCSSRPLGHRAVIDLATWHPRPPRPRPQRTFAAPDGD